jgi:HD-like signal output (HDOD) protein
MASIPIRSIDSSPVSPVPSSSSTQLSAAQTALRAVCEERDPAVVYAALVRHAWSLPSELCAALGRYNTTARKRESRGTDAASVVRNTRLAAEKARTGDALLAAVAAACEGRAVR